jgi:putative hydrolase of the HAD superfamily
MFKYVLLDLDNTLYPPDSGLWEAIGARINAFMIERLGMNPREVDEKRRSYLNSFGTTLNALRHYHGTDPEEFLTFVHDLPLSDFLRPDPTLEGMLAKLSLRKAIFTNADAAHARRVLGRLGILRHFDRIIDIYALEFVNKPDPRAYFRALEFVSALPEECVFADDSPVNLLAAGRIGMKTVLVGSAAGMAGIDHRIGRITELAPLIDRLISESGD